MNRLVDAYWPQYLQNELESRERKLCYILKDLEEEGDQTIWGRLLRKVRLLTVQREGMAGVIQR